MFHATNAADLLVVLVDCKLLDCWLSVCAEYSRSNIATCPRQQLVQPGVSEHYVLNLPFLLLVMHLYIFVEVMHICIICCIIVVLAR